MKVAVSGGEGTFLRPEQTIADTALICTVLHWSSRVLIGRHESAVVYPGMFPRERARPDLNTRPCHCSTLTFADGTIPGRESKVRDTIRSKGGRETSSEALGQLGQDEPASG